MPVELLYTWMMVFLRGVGLILLFPTLGGRPMPVMLRVALSAMLATLLYGLVPRVPALPMGNFTLVVAAGGEIILGLVFGFVGRLLFGAVEMAGRVIASEVGLIAAPGFDVPQPSQEPLPAFLYTFAGVLFFLFGGHLGAISAFARSFDFAPAGRAGFNPLAGELLLTATSHVIELGFRIAAPFIAMNFLVSLAFSVLGRAVPKMNVFIASNSVRSILGFALLASAGTLITRYVLTDINDLPLRMLELLPAR